VKVAISARGPNPNSEVDESFGRAYWFIIYDEATTLWSAVDNSEIRNSHDNVGVKASRLLTELGVDVLITGETGPKAYRALSEEGIDVFHDASGTVQETYLAWQRGLLRKAAHANRGEPILPGFQAGAKTRDGTKGYVGLAEKLPGPLRIDSRTLNEKRTGGGG